MQYKFDKYLRELLPEKNPKIGVAVSGGADSMCLLDLLYNSSLAPELTVAHVNFNLRGAESDADEVLVREWTKNRSIPCLVKSVETEVYARERGISIEMAAREIRYAWFAELRRELGLDYIAVAHHANDNAETLFLNLVRGTGMRGLCGMQAMDREQKILRPLLGYTREEIEKQVQKRRIVYRTDHTNLESDFARNRIRNQIMPQLEQINASVVKTLNRDMGYFTDAAGILAEAAREKMERLCMGSGDKFSLFQEQIKNEALRNYIVKASSGYFESAMSIEKLMSGSGIRYWLYEWLAPYHFNASQVEDVFQSLSSAETRRFLSDPYVAVKERGFLKVYKKEILSPWTPVLIEKFTGEKTVRAAGLDISLNLSEANAPLLDALMQSSGRIYRSGTTLAVSADHLRFPLVCRSMQPGDKWKPFGMKGEKKLSDYLTDIKMDHLLRSRLPFLCNGGEANNPGHIVCLPGLQIEDAFKITSRTREVLMVAVH